MLVWPFDSLIVGAVPGLDLPGDLRKAIQLSEAFAHGSGVFCILGSIYWIADTRRKQVWLAVLITIASGITANLLKSSFIRIRPYAADSITVSADTTDSLSPSSAASADKQLVRADFWDARQRSFPSGHAATAWGLALGLMLIFPRGWWIFGMLATLSSAQRIVSDAHYPSDVLAGTAIAFAWGSLLIWLSHQRRIGNFLEERTRRANSKTVDWSSKQNHSKAA